MGRYDAVMAELRIAAQPDRPPAEGMREFLEGVRAHAYRITDRDVDALREAGFSEDEIFEQAVAVAVSEGLRRYEAGLRALR